MEKYFIGFIVIVIMGFSVYAEDVQPYKDYLLGISDDVKSIMMMEFDGEMSFIVWLCSDSDLTSEDFPTNVGGYPVLVEHDKVVRIPEYVDNGNNIDSADQREESVVDKSEESVVNQEEDYLGREQGSGKYLTDIQRDFSINFELVVVVILGLIFSGLLFNLVWEFIKK